MMRSMAAMGIWMRFRVAAHMRAAAVAGWTSRVPDSSASRLGTAPECDVPRESRGALAMAKSAKRAGARSNRCRRWMACRSPSRRKSIPRATGADRNGRRNDGAAPQSADAPPAARLREAGCVILGKTTCPISACCPRACPHPRRHPQSVEHDAQYVGLELGRRRRRRRGLRAAAPRHRHRRLGTAARDALRHLRAEAEPGPRAGLSALHRPRHRTHDEKRSSGGRADEPAVETGRAGFHEPAVRKN